MKFYAALSLAVLLLSELDSVFGQARAGPNAQQLCKTNSKRSMFPHEEYCDYYYECINGEAIVQTCPNGLAFAGQQKGIAANCDYPHRVGCPDDNRVMGQQAISSENCHWQYGVFAHATSCTRYWHCWNGTAAMQQCPFSLLYNDKVHSCDWPANVPDCQKHPICKDTPDGAVSIEKSCVRYWLCVGGYPRLQRCPAGLALSTTSLKCELAQTVPGCEPPPTLLSEEEEDGGGGSSSGSASPKESSSNSASSSSGATGDSRLQQPSGALPQQFRPSQSGVRLTVG